ncbi:lasso peptide isopeptide bond-forming cyclase [Peribacillus cavernae]|uniref:asparagine synthase (glutamine-hydrolyzing) n=1 Tax=Peribacillus cavernae TaxID=1674310 RepID=A0A433HP11_9BACI|nr:lasso peptide isopeptide bond-forming cyclase [Peribacillus cavernae]MDQ0217476.1 asparagine synthase (glutamine-hydrolyzing) [Peribacillus cavernae]RUQ30081.1 lasso peptide isopeptide bond-forming cyclase [Peribacillus cavernae]
MSAIAGIYNCNNEPIHIEHINGMMESLQHYPADDIQVWRKENIFLGCHAQWITPESIGEQQPYYDYERKIVITADSIIDNRDELFDRLQIEPSRRKTMSDSQLILLAYHKWGEESPKHLIGDFAFMLWDENKQRLFGARDFSGTRTLYYYHNQQKFSFSTVIKPLLSLPFIEKRINEQWMAEYLAINGMFETIEPFSTVYKNIEQLPPAHTISINNGRISLSKYVSVTAGETLKLKSNSEYEEAFRDVFRTAVTARTRTNRKVGAHLSGGLDSGSVVSFAAKSLHTQSKRLHTFSYVPVDDFQDWTPKYRMADERPYIQSTVQHVGNITDTYLDFGGKSPLSEVDDWLDTYEMPYKFFENSFWLKGVYEKAHEEGVGLLLNGARGNWTISWGPALDYQAMLLKRLNVIRFYRELHRYSKNVGVKKSRVMSVVGRKAFPFLHKTKSIEPDEQETFINPDLAKRTAVFEKLKEHGVDLPLSTIPNAYEERKKHFKSVTFWSTNGAVATKLSLRFNLWNRDPTNDLRVIRFTLSVPEEQFVQNGLDRSLVRRATENYLPDKVRLNQKVRGIQGSDGVHRMTPNWHMFIDEIDRLMADQVMSGFINVDVINNARIKVQEAPPPEYVFDPEFKMLMRSLIVYRFIKNFT